MTVKQKQWQLKLLGHYTGLIDGQWGVLSATGTKTFQTKYSLDDDSVFGPIAEETSRNLIRKIQAAINAFMGHDPNNGEGLVEDGLAGPATEAALKLFQQKKGLCVTGTVTEETWAAIETVPEEDPGADGDWWDNIRYFDREEFKCQCWKHNKVPLCDGYPAEMQRGVVELADRARAHFGNPATVISGLRCPQHNANEGGVAGSRHMTGKAIDLYIPGISSARLLTFMQQQPEVRYAYAINSTNVHFDIE